MRHKILTTLI